MSGNTSETRCKHCGAAEASYRHNTELSPFAHKFEPTPPEGEAVPEQRVQRLTWTEETIEIINKLTPNIKDKAFDPDWFLLRQRFEKIERQTTSAPVVSTAAPEPLYTEQELKDQGLVAVKTDYGKEGSATMYVPVAPESYKPAHTNRHGERCSEACGQVRHAECMETFQTCNCTFRGLHKTMHRYATIPAATPVTVEAPHPLQSWQYKAAFAIAKMKDSISTDHYDVLKIMNVFAEFEAKNAATPKPIGDVEALLDELATSPDKTYCQRGRDELRAILSPFFAPAGPREDITPSSIAKWLRVQEKEIRPWDSNERNEIFRLLMAFAIDHLQVPAQPPCSECATLSEINLPWTVSGDSPSKPPMVWDASGDSIVNQMEDGTPYFEPEIAAFIGKAANSLAAHELECATLRKERDDLLAMFCERHIDTTLSDANVNDDCPLCITESSAEAAEAQLSTLRSLDVNGIAETIAHEVCDETPKMHGNLPCWPGTHIIAEKVKQHLRAALAPTPEVAKEGK